MKKIFFIGVAILMIFSALYISASAQSGEIDVYLDGEKIEFDVSPQIINGRTMVPIRAIFEKMGANVNWNNETRTATCVKENTVVEMTVDSEYVVVNGQYREMDTTPVIVDGRTLAPARYVAEAFGATVDWSQESNSVLIYSEKQITLYASDGRTISVAESDVPAYLNVGWYRTFAEADAVNKPPKSPSDSSSYNPSPNGNYYRTPTGKKYHLDPNCGGKNSYKTTNISGLSPCKKCAQ